MKRCIFIAALFAAFTASSAIVTVRNALFTWPPNYATFIGTESQPGIESPWIPYGTYTHGVGTTEYARISAKLMGVVASVFDGRYEREYLPEEDFTPTNPAAYYSVFKQTMLPCYTNFPGFSDNGQFLQSLTNNTARILDTINAQAFVEVDHVDGSSTYSYFRQQTGEIEPLLAAEETADGNSWHWGVAKIYAGDALAAMCAAAQLATEPPISTTWTNRLPFVAADSNAWVNVWPTYSALANDAHFFPAATNATPKFGRYHLDNHYAPYSTPRFFEPAHLVEIWGGDVVGNETSGTARALELALESIPMGYTIEDVLSYNTGWKYEYPPAATGSYWTVAGPLGNFKLDMFYDYSPDYLGWDNWSEPPPTNYYVEIGYNFYGSNYSLMIYDAPTGEQLFYQYVVASKDADTLYFGDYRADRTRLYNGDDDYAHWRNGTARLDWKRLGIICQLISQMDRTYLARQDEDELALLENDARHTYTWEASEIVTLATSGGVPAASTTFMPPSAWARTGDSTTCTTNLVGWSYPTAQLHGVGDSGLIQGTSDAESPELWVDAATLAGIISPIAQQVVADHGLTDGQLVIEISGLMTPLGNAGMTWPWGVDFANFFPTIGDGDQYYPTNSGTAFFAPLQYPTSATADLTMFLNKYATTKYTTASESMYTNFAARLTPYPLPEVWATNYVKRQRRPTLKVMLDTQGFSKIGVITNSAPLVWGDIAGPNSTRQFRMDKQAGDGSWATTRQSSNRLRWVITRDLNADVMGRFQQLANIAVDDAAWRFIDFPPAEEAALKAQLITRPLSLIAALQPAVGSASPVAIIVGVVPVANGTAGDCAISSATWAWEDSQGEWQYQAITQGASGYLLGTYYFTVQGAELPYMATTNQPVRVDGHQDQMMATEWLPRNLRFVDN